MRNCIVLGSGRSGTSMTTGIFAKAGYFMGDNLYSGDESNPKGYFEDVEVNSINEDLIAQIFPQRPAGILGKTLFRSRMGVGQRWLAQVPVGTNISCPPPIEERIKKLTARSPYCFKDPRFCYTLPVWRRFLGDPIFLCVFRHPAVTASSIVTICKKETYLRSLPMSLTTAVRIWELMYRHVLENHAREGEWIFVHYNQFLDGSVFSRLEKSLGIAVDKGFIDAKLKRSLPAGQAADSAMDTYRKLCALADYTE